MEAWAPSVHDPRSRPTALLNIHFSLTFIPFIPFKFTSMAALLSEAAQLPDGECWHPDSVGVWDKKWTCRFSLPFRIPRFGRVGRPLRPFIFAMLCDDTSTSGSNLAGIHRVTASAELYRKDERHGVHFLASHSVLTAVIKAHEHSLYFVFRGAAIDTPGEYRFRIFFIDGEGTRINCCITAPILVVPDSEPIPVLPFERDEDELWAVLHPGAPLFMDGTENTMVTTKLSLDVDKHQPHHPK
ncbi:hypothetical protein B0T22DRAFT_443209 [Podospora appendiculata]|uniref:Uncharacterized protein n=1 Tax=Podospora appendiculata TaxID=314037 RepID=A0AAE0X6D8_9PEZI|nr:hypothetical protein B0T22DRAFT_443209 [Podospora appendiculata]